MAVSKTRDKRNKEKNKTVYLTTSNLNQCTEQTADIHIRGDAAGYDVLLGLTSHVHVNRLNTSRKTACGGQGKSLYFEIFILHKPKCIFLAQHKSSAREAEGYWEGWRGQAGGEPLLVLQTHTLYMINVAYDLQCSIYIWSYISWG